jgi:acyl carrier protein
VALPLKRVEGDADVPKITNDHTNISDKWSGAPVGVYVLETIRNIVHEGEWLAGEPAIGDNDDLYALGLTSHASVELMLALEDAFDIEFPEKMLKRSTFETVASLHEALREIRK